MPTDVPRVQTDTLSTPLAGDQLDFGQSSPRETSFIQGRKTSLTVAVLNVMNAIMGSGILALPSVMAENGIALYVGLQVGIMVIVDFSLHLLVRASLNRKVF